MEQTMKATGYSDQRDQERYAGHYTLLVAVLGEAPSEEANALSDVPHGRGGVGEVRWDRVTAVA